MVSSTASALAVLLGESCRRDTPQAAVWSDLVVVLPPACNALPGLRQRFKPLLIQAFIPELAVEALDVAVLHRLTRFNQDVAYPVLMCPGQERTAGELVSSPEQ